MKNKILSLMGRFSETVNTRGVAILCVFLLTFYTFSSALLPATAAPPTMKLSMTGFVLSGSYDAGSGQPSGAGKFKNGNSGHYPEGACIPVSLQLENLSDVDDDFEATIVYDYFATVHGYTGLEAVTSSLADPLNETDDLNDLSFANQSLTSATSFPTLEGSTVSAVVTGPFEGDEGTTAPSATDDEQHYTIVLEGLPAGETADILFCGRLGEDAGQYSDGASLSIRLGEKGAENIAVSPNQLLLLPSLTIQKLVDGGDAEASDFTFTVSPAIDGTSQYSIPSGYDSLTIENVLDGVYSITESDVEGYSLSDSAGTNCDFTEDTASATVAAGAPATDATCIFTNSFVDATSTLTTLTVEKIVINDDSGTSVVDNFELFINATSVASGVANVLPAGDYVVSEATSTDYIGTFSGDCDENGNVSLADGEEKICTLTNDDVEDDIVDPFVATTGTLMVVKEVINDEGGTGAVDDFELFIDAGSVVSGVENVLVAGDYVVSEATSTDYVGTFSGDCDDSGNVSLAVGEEKICTITNDDVGGGGGDVDPFVATTGTLIVISNVINDNGGSDTSSDFTFHVTGTSPSVTDFSGNASGTYIVLMAGSYSVSQDPRTNYAAAFSEDCDGTINAGEELTCTVTNDDEDTGSGGGGGPTSYFSDLGITKDTSSSTVLLGSEFIYTLTVTNIGPDPATRASVADLLPIGLLFEAATATHGLYSSTTGVWDIGGLDLNEVATLDMLVSVTSTDSSFINSATVSAIEIDPVHENNTAEVTVNIFEPGSNGGGSNGGGGDGGIPTTGTASPTPIVLGVSTEAPDPIEAPVAPEPIVLGAYTEELPRTGAPANLPAVALLLGLAVALIAPKFKLENES